MARIYQTGWEMGSINIYDIRAAGALETTIVRGSWSTYSMRGSDGSTFSLPSAPSELYSGFGFYSNSGGNTSPILQYVSPAGTINLDLRMDGASHLRVSRNGTTLATGTAIIAVNTWYFVEFYGLINSSTGKYQVKVNGVDDIALATGQNTRADGGAGGDTCDRITLMTANGYYMDDLYINDTTGSTNTGFSGDIRISAYIPNGAGSVTGLTRGGADSGSNFGQVDERPPNDATDYVYGSDTSSYDLYALPNTSGISTVQAVMLWIKAQKSDAGVANFAPIIKSGAAGATETTGSDVTLSSSWTEYQNIYNIDPADSVAWTPTRIDNLQIGVKSR